MEWIDIEHPGTGGKARVSRRNYERQLAAKGWRPADDTQPAAPPDADTDTETSDEEDDVAESVPSWADADDDETEEV